MDILPIQQEQTVPCLADPCEAESLSMIKMQNIGVVKLPIKEMFNSSRIKVVSELRSLVSKSRVLKTS